MKAEEVLKRYANGERNFQRANLRGCNFKGKDLSGADFSEAEIQGTNFSRANLQRAIFIGAKAGIQKRWMLVQQIFAFVLSAVSSFLSVITGLFIFDSSFGQFGFIFGFVIIGLLVTIFLAIFQQGFTFQTFITISFAFVSAFAITIVVITVTQPGMTELNTVVVIVVTFSAGFASAVTFASAVASVFAIGFSFAAAITAAVALYFGFPSFYTSGDDSSIYSAAVNSAFANAANVSVGSGFAVAFTSTLLGIYCSHRALEGDEKFSLIRTISVAFGAIGGTSFRGADLTYANFSKALLKSTNFTNIWERGAQGKRRKCETLLDWVRWQDAQKLDRARVGNSILSTPAARELLVTPNGYKKSYVNVKL